MWSYLVNVSDDKIRQKKKHTINSAWIIRNFYLTKLCMATWSGVFVPTNEAPNCSIRVSEASTELRSILNSQWQLLVEKVGRGKKKGLKSALFALVPFSYKKRNVWCFLAALIAPSLHYQPIMWIRPLTPFSQIVQHVRMVTGRPDIQRTIVLRPTRRPQELRTGASQSLRPL
jgi:hypothetical protein